MDAQVQRRTRASSPFHRCDGLSYGFKEPGWFPDDGGKRREPVIDLECKRVVRRVGWQRCLGPKTLSSPHRFFSPDVVKVRTCDECKKRLAMAQSNLGSDD